MNIFIVNMDGFRNKGCEAMTKVIFNQLNKNIPGSQFKVFSNDPEYDEQWNPDANSISFYPTLPTDSFTKLYSSRFLVKPNDLIIRLYNFTKMLFRKKEPHIINYRLFHDADLIISTGGDVFSSEYGEFLPYLFPINIGTYYKKPVVLLAHSIGPFKTLRERYFFTKVVKDIPLITIRESFSFEYVSKILSKDSRIELTADPAFILPTAHINRVEKLCKRCNIPSDSNIVGISASQGISRYANEDYVSHLNMLLRMIEFLRQNNFHVILIPHVREQSFRSNDHFICNRLYRELGYPNNVSVLNLDLSTEEIKGIIGRCDLLIAERMHAAISGLSQLVPTLVVGYSVKARGILRDIFGLHYLEYMIPIKKLSEENLRKKFAVLWDKRKETSKALSNVIPDIKKRAKKNFELIMEII